MNLKSLGEPAWLCFFIYSLLIEYLEDRNSKLAVWKGYIFAVAMFLTATIQSFVLQYYFHHCYLLGMKLKTAMLGLIYEKVIERVSE